MNKNLSRYILLVFLITLGLAACDKKDDQKTAVIRPVKSIIVAKPESTLLKQFPGSVLAGKELKLSFEVTGRLIALPINEGEIVHKGQLIARMDPKKFQEKVNETRAKYLENVAQFKRAKALIKDKFISQAQYDATQANFKVSEANYNTAKHNFNDTFLKAPFAGIIAKKYVDNFEFVKAKQTIADLHNTGAVDIAIDVPENIMINLSHQQNQRDKAHHPVAIFNAKPMKKYPLTFKEVTTSADTQTQTYRIVFTMKRPTTLNILPGMNVNVAAEMPDYNAQSKSFYLLPAGAVFIGKDQKPMIWVINPKTMTVTKQAVKTAGLTKNKIKILSGIKAGDRVVTAGVHYLRDGEKVKLLEKNH